MAKKPVSHPYADQSAFERLLLLITTFLESPGVGGSRLSHAADREHNALEAVQARIQEMAQQMKIALPHYSVNTLRKDLVTLRRYGVLGQQMYRWGYYLGTGAMNREELQVMLQALRSQAQQQGNPQARQVYETLEQRLRGLNLRTEGTLFYPVRSQLDRVIVQTDPEEMMRQGHYRHTLFHQLETIETAIVQGQQVELYRQRDPYGTMQVGRMRVYPLQLIYSEIAWYLLYEYAENQHLEIERVDRLGETCRVIDAVGRGLVAQQRSLDVGQQLLRQGWGLYLGNVEEQHEERLRQHQLVMATVRFFEPVLSFLVEGERRHPTQKIRKGSGHDGAYLDYSVSLPKRSLGEFGRWVNRFMENAQVLAPVELKKRHRRSAERLVDRYGK